MAHVEDVVVEGSGVDSAVLRPRYPPDPSSTASNPSFVSVDPPRPRVIDASQIYLFSVFVYQIGLLRLPTTYVSLASNTLCLEDGTWDLNQWDTFTEILLKQWTTLGLLSTLIFGATLTMFQIPSIMNSSVLPIVAHFVLLCTMMSLIYTCLLGVYFEGWKSISTSEKWMQEVRTADPHTFWNVWVLISLPALWTCWAIFSFLVSMVLFVWPLGQQDSSQDSLDGAQESLGARVFLLMVALAGAAHLALAISSLRRVNNPASTTIDA